MFVYIFCSFFNWVARFLIVQLWEFIIRFGYKSCVGHVICKCFLPVCSWDIILSVHVRKEWNWYLLGTYYVLDIVWDFWRSRGMSKTEFLVSQGRGERWNLDTAIQTTTRKIWATWGQSVRQKKEMVAQNGQKWGLQSQTAWFQLYHLPPVWLWTSY